MRMLAKRPAARPATMHDVASELNSVLHDTLIAPEDMLQSLRDAAHDYPGPAENTTLDALNVTQALPISDSDDDDNIDLPPVDLVQKPKQSAAPVPDNLSVGPYADGKRDDRDDLPLVDLKELADSAHAALPRIEDVFRAGSSRPRVRRTGVWLTAAVLAAIALGVFFWLPRLVEKPAPIVQATVNESAATAVDAAARAERAKSWQPDSLNSRSSPDASMYSISAAPRCGAVTALRAPKRWQPRRTRRWSATIWTA